MQKLEVPIKENEILKLNAGEWVEIFGDIIVMRDAAHKKLLLDNVLVNKLQDELKNSIVFYAGPTSGFIEKKGVIGPTTSSRMDKYVENMIALGVRGFLGKGPRSKFVASILKENKAVYLATVGGAAALLSKFVKEAKIIAYEELGPEAIYKLTVENFPAIVAIDSMGEVYP